MGEQRCARSFCARCGQRPNLIWRGGEHKIDGRAKLPRARGARSAPHSQAAQGLELRIVRRKSERAFGRGRVPPSEEIAPERRSCSRQLAAAVADCRQEGRQSVRQTGWQAGGKQASKLEELPTPASKQASCKASDGDQRESQRKRARNRGKQG